MRHAQPAGCMTGVLPSVMTLRNQEAACIGNKLEGELDIWALRFFSVAETTSVQLWWLHTECTLKWMRKFSDVKGEIPERKLKKQDLRWLTTAGHLPANRRDLKGCWGEVDILTLFGKSKQYLAILQWQPLNQMWYRNITFKSMQEITDI